MEYTLYLDLFFLTDFFFNLLALILSAGVLGEKVIWLRLAMSAGVGSLWNCALLVFPVFSAFEELALTAAAVGSLMVFLAFRTATPEKTVRAAAALFISSAMLEGCLSLLRQYAYLSDMECLFFAGIVSFGGSHFLRILPRRRPNGGNLYQVWLFYRGKRKKFLALADSGNRLTVPGTGKPVAVIARRDCDGFCDRVSGGFFIPYRAVGTEEGVLFAVPFEKMEILNEGKWIRIEKPVVAIAGQRLSSDDEFSMLIPECFLLERD